MNIFHAFLRHDVTTTVGSPTISVFHRICQNFRHCVWSMVLNDQCKSSLGNSSNLHADPSPIVSGLFPVLGEH